MDRSVTMKFPITAWLCICLISLLGLIACSARTQPSTEGRIAGRIAVVIQFYVNEHNGLMPTNWSQLSAHLVSNDRELLEDKGEVIPAAYVFTPTNLYKADFREGRVIAARSNPIKENKRMGRYVIYENTDKDIWTDWMNEEEFQAMLVECGVSLPKPNLDEVEGVKAAVAQLIAREQQEREMARKSVPSLTASEVCAIWWERIQSWFVIPGAGGSSRVRWGSVVTVSVGLAGLGGLAVWWWKRK